MAKGHCRCHDDAHWQTHERRSTSISVLDQFDEITDKPSTVAVAAVGVGVSVVMILWVLRQAKRKLDELTEAARARQPSAAEEVRLYPGSREASREQLV